MLKDNGDRLNSMKPCSFCSLPQPRVIDSSPLGLVIRDAFPISPGHTLIIPKRHVGSFFDLEANKRSELLALLDKAKAVADKEFSSQGYNIDINDVAAAGQTVPHLHIHLIPQCNAPKQGMHIHCNHNLRSNRTSKLAFDAQNLGHNYSNEVIFPVLLD